MSSTSSTSPCASITSFAGKPGTAVDPNVIDRDGDVTERCTKFLRERFELRVPPGAPCGQLDNLRFVHERHRKPTTSGVASADIAERLPGRGFAPQPRSSGNT